MGALLISDSGLLGPGFGYFPDTFLRSRHYFDTFLILFRYLFFPVIYYRYLFDTFFL